MTTSTKSSTDKRRSNGDREAANDHGQNDHGGNDQGAGDGSRGGNGNDAGDGTPPAHENQADRKTRVLTSHTASRVESIADAVVIKDGEPFFLCPPNGELGVRDGHGYGLYHHDTRYLSGYELKIAGIHPNSLAATAVTGDRMELELTMPEVEVGNGRTIGKERLAVHWTRRLDGSGPRLKDHITIRNYDAEPATLPVDLTFSADFRDVFAIRGLLDERPGAIHDPAWDGDRLGFAYDGKDGINRSLTVEVSPGPEHRQGKSCGLRLAVDGRGEVSFDIEITVAEQARSGATPIEGRTGRQHRDEAESAEETDRWPVRVTSDSLTLNGVVGRSLEDLLTLRSELAGHRYEAAGVPWFSTLFGRDSLIASLQTLAFDPSIAAGTLRVLASRQGTRHDDFRDEEPGKILHELRIGELARLNEIPQTPYYGSIDSTPLFLILLARHASWVGSLDLFHELRSNVDRALDWIDRSIAAGELRYLAYDSTTKHGLVNQGWKDSGDGIVTGDGSIATPPIALAEVQGYVHAAWRGVADLLERDGDRARADDLRRRADELRDRFEHDFWSDRLGCYVLALQAGGKPCDVVASNAGQVLWGGIASQDHAASVARRLLADDMFSGWGIRTLATNAVAANPIGYHLGTVWPHDNGLIAAGFRRYGLHDAVERVLVGLIEASTDFPQQRLPECFAGFARGEFGVPVRYPIACHPQAWAAGSMLHLVETTLGLVPEAFDRRLRVVEPRLPPFMEHLELEGVRVGDGRAHLVFDRSGGSTTASVAGVDGDLDVAVEP
jgi:glycogen debranching enzyme